MSLPFTFDINKYMGTWYELMHYPSWFQRNDNYNTTAEYKLNSDGTVSVHNSTMSNSMPFESYGKARRLNSYSFRVDFPIPEVAKLQMSNQFKSIPEEELRMMQNPNMANYVIDKIWFNQYGEYIFAVVTDPTKSSLYVLSRYKHPSLASYNEIMTYVIANYNRDRLVQTPHFD